MEVLSLFKNNVNSIQLFSLCYQLSAQTFTSKRHKLPGNPVGSMQRHLPAGQAWRPCLGGSHKLEEGCILSATWRLHSLKAREIQLSNPGVPRNWERREVLGKGPRGKKSSLGSHCGSSEPSVQGLLRRATWADSSARNCGRKRQCSYSCVLFGGVDFTTEI